MRPHPANQSATAGQTYRRVLVTNWAPPQKPPHPHPPPLKVCAPDLQQVSWQGAHSAIPYPLGLYVHTLGSCHQSPDLPFVCVALTDQGTIQQVIRLFRLGAGLWTCLPIPGRLQIVKLIGRDNKREEGIFCWEPCSPKKFNNISIGSSAWGP